MEEQLKLIHEMGEKITYADGSPMFSEKNPQAFYEIVMALQQKNMAISEVKNYINERVYNDEADFIFRMKMVDKERELFDRRLFYMVNKIKSENGIPCKRCKSKNTEWKFKQVRSSDESASIKFTCHECGYTDTKI